MKRTAGPGARALQFVFALSWLIAARSTASELAIDWTAPLGCPSRDELTSRVAQLIGGAVRSDLIAATEVTHAADGYRALVRVERAAGAGERVLENARCDVLMESVALVLAMSTLMPEQHSDEDARHAFVASAHGAALFGPLPKPALGVGAALGLDIQKSFRVEIRGTYYLSQSATFDQDDTLGGAFRLYRFAARGCRLFNVGIVELGPCLGADVAHLRANGFGGITSYDRKSTWWAPAGSLFGRVRFAKSFSVYLVAEGIAPLSRRAFVFSDVGALYRPWPLALQLLIAPEARF